MSKADRKPRVEFRSTYELLVGRAVSKASGKPFKSHRKINTVRAVVEDERFGLCFAFNEDDSLVECWRCRVEERFYEFEQKQGCPGRPDERSF